MISLRLILIFVGLLLAWPAVGQTVLGKSTSDKVLAAFMSQNTNANTISMYLSNSTVPVQIPAAGMVLGGELRTTWPSGGSGTPGGSTTQVQFNDAGAFGGDSSFTFDAGTQTLNVEKFHATGVSLFGDSVTAFSFSGNGAALTFDGSANNGNLATSINTLQELNDAVDNLSLGGSGNFGTNNFGTNIVLFTHDNDPDATIAPALTFKPLEKRTIPGGSMTVWMLEPPYTNTGFLGKFKLIIGVATNTFGDLRPDITHNYGYNFSGNGAGIDTNEPAWLDTRETRWQNGVGLSQSEIWHSFGTPYTDYGTNTGFRYMGFNLNWNTTARTYSSSDGNITIDSFYFGVPSVGTTPGNGLPAITFAKSRTNSMLQTLNQQSQISFSGNTHPDGQFLVDAEGQNLAGRYQYGMSAFGSPVSAKSNAIVLMPGTSLAGASPMILLGQTNAYAGFRWNVLSNRLEYSANAGGVATASLFWKPFNAFSEGWKSTYLSTSLSSTAGDYRELGYVTNHLGGNLSAFVVLTVVGFNNTDSARYQVPLLTADGQSSTWKECLPISRGVNTASLRIAVDVRGLSTTSALFRLRQLGSSTESNIRVTIELYGSSNGNGSPNGTDWVDQSSNSGSGATVASYYRHNPLTQVLGKVGIGTNNPSDTLQVFGGVSALNLTNATTTAAFVYANADGGYGEATTANFIASVGGTPNGAKVLRDDWTWVALAGGGDALVANPLSQFAATTSAQLRGVMSDESGTGPLLFQDGNIGAASGTSLTLSSLTATRVTFAGTAGLLSDDADFTFATTGNALRVAGSVATPKVWTDAIEATNGSSLTIIAGGDTLQLSSDTASYSGNGGFAGAGHQLTFDNEAYDLTGWDGDNTAPTKNATRDIIATLAPLVSPSFTTPNIGVASGTSLTLSSLTSGRVPFATTAGLLTDDAGFTFNGSTDTLAVRHGIATTNIFDSEGFNRFSANGDGDAVGATELWDGNQKRIQITRGVSGDPFGFIRLNDHAGNAVVVVTQGVVSVQGSVRADSAIVTNRVRQPFAQLMTSGDVTNYVIDFAATVPNNHRIMATGNVYFVSIDNIEDGVVKNIVITNVFKASSNITVYVQTNLLWLGPTNGYFLGASPMHTNRGYSVTNSLVLSLQTIGSTAPSIAAFAVHNTP